MTLTTSIMVRDHNNPTVVATTGSFTVAPAPAETMTIRTPLGVVVGSQIVLSGSYANGTPASIDYSTDNGATWFPLGSPAISGGSWSGSGPTYSAANAGAQIIVRDHTNTTVTATTAVFAVTAAPVGGSLFSQPFTFKNPEDKAAQINPFFTLGIPFAPSEVPATGTKMVLADASGSNVIGELQVDQKANGWTDSSTNMAVVSGVLTGSTLNPGDIASVTIKCIPGTPNLTPCCTLAQLTARTDIKLVCKIGADTYTVSVNKIIQNYNYGSSRPNYPVGFIDQWKYGPQICEWTFAQYLIRDSDGAQDRWKMMKVYLSVLANGNMYVLPVLENAQAYGPHPAGTIGPTGLAGMQTVDSIDIYNGATRVGAGGGPNDQRALTFAPAAVNVADATITVPLQGLSSNNSYDGPFYTCIGFSSTGNLPGGVGSETYWVKADSKKNLIPFISRNWLARVDRVAKKMNIFAAGLAVTTFNYLVVGGVSYLCTKAGVSAGVLPSGTSSVDGTVTWSKVASTNSSQVPLLAAGSPVTTAYYVINGGAYWCCSKNGTSAGNLPNGSAATFTDGTVVWTRVTAPLSDQGTGTHKVFPKVSVAQYQKAAICGLDTYPIWIGSGQMPQLMPGYPVKYLTQKSRATPPLKMDANPQPWCSDMPSYWWNTSYLPGQTNYYYIGDTASSPVDERITSWSAIAGSNIMLPNDLGTLRSMRFIGLSWLDRIYYCRDERAQQVVVGSYGPDRVGGTYPGMAPCNPLANLGNTGGAPNFIGVAADPMNWPGYGGDLGSTQPWESTHAPNPLYWAYVHSGHPVFLDGMMEYCNSQFMQGGGAGSQQIRYGKVNGKYYAWACNFGSQARGYGHQLKTTWQTEWSIPSNHTAKPYFSDRMDDTSNQFMNWTRANFSATAVANGWIPTVYNSKSWPQAAYEPWMEAFFVQHIAQLAWINTRPGYHEILDYAARMWLKLYDSDLRGHEKMADVQWFWVATTIIGASSDQVPNDADFISNGYDALVGTFGSNPATNAMMLAYPPPQNNFINGLRSLGLGHYEYYTAPISPGQYLPITRSALVLGAVAGHPQFAKVLTRINNLLDSSGVPIQWVLSVGQRNGNGNLNAFQYAVDAF